MSRRRPSPPAGTEAATPFHARAAEIASKVVVGYFAVLTCWSVFQVADSMRARAAGALYPDFEALLLAGRLALRGRLADAYAWSTMSALERADGIGADAFLPFAYPPPFALAMAGLSGMPGWIAYLAFDLVGLGFFVTVLVRLPGGRSWPLAAAAAPACYVCAIAGQNGSLLAALVGLSAVAALRGGSHASGALAGLLGAAKPQVAIALPLLFVVRRDWRAATASLAVAAAALSISAVLAEPGAWMGFLGGLSETSRALAQGRFPLHRMASTYACLRSFGAASGVALAAHVAVAALGLATVAAASRRVGGAQTAAGLILMATALVSPYFYDYDLPVVALGLALVLPALERAGGGWRSFIPLAGLGLAGFIGYGLPEAAPRLSLGAPLLVAGLAVALGALCAKPAAAVASPC